MPCNASHQPPPASRSRRRRVSTRPERRAKLEEVEVESAYLDDEGQVVAVDGAGRGEGHHAQSARRGPRYREVAAIGCSHHQPTTNDNN
jgi:hypothetical protein